MIPGRIDFRTAAYFVKPIAVAYLFAWLEVGLPFPDVLGILLVQLFEFQCLVFHQELAFLVLHLTMIQVWSLKHFFQQSSVHSEQKPIAGKARFSGLRFRGRKSRLRALHLKQPKLELPDLLQFFDGRLRRSSGLFELTLVFLLEPVLLSPVTLLFCLLELKIFKRVL